MINIKKYTPIKDGWYGDIRFDGRFYSVIRDKGVQTNDGVMIPIESPGNNCLFLQAHPLVDGVFSGKSHIGPVGNVLNYAAGWEVTDIPTYGNTPIIFDNNGEQHIIHNPPGVGAQGYGYVDFYTNRIVPADQCTKLAGVDLWNYTYLGDNLWIGQTAVDNPELGDTGIYDGKNLRKISDDPSRFIRAHRKGENDVVFYYWCVDGRDAIAAVTTMAELRALPLFDSIVVPPPGETMIKPEVTVTKWNLDELKDGRSFEFFDRENGGPSVRVHIKNGSMYAEISNAVGTGSTGLERKVKPCTTTPPTTPPPIPPPTPNPGVIQPVRVDGKVFRTPDNKIFPWRFATGFLLGRRWCEGDVQGAKDYINAWSALGYNGLRVFSQVNWNGNPGPGFFPSNYPQYWNNMGDMFNYAASKGIYIEFVNHTGPDSVDNLVAWSNKCRDFTNPFDNVFNELCNEPPVNGIDVEGLFERLDKNFRNPWSTGKYYPDAVPAGTYCTPHTDRDAEWPRKARHLLEYRDGGGPWDPSNPAMNRPIVSDEPIGGADFEIPGRRSNSTSDFYSYAALCQMFSAGATFHHEFGLNAIFPDGIELDCAKAFIAGLKSVNPDFQLGEYTATHISTSPCDDTSLRTYSMILGNQAVSSRIRPSVPNPTPRPGWNLVGSAGTTLYWSRV